jgi:hypothetical protein
VFRNTQSEFLGGFVQNIGQASALITELSAAMYAIEKAVDLHYNRVILPILLELSTIMGLYRGKLVLDGTIVSI